MCDIFTEMRSCVKTLNFSYLIGLIEEAQSAAARMEARIADMKDHKWLLRDIKDLKEKKQKLKDDVGDDSRY